MIKPLIRLNSSISICSGGVTFSRNSGTSLAPIRFSVNANTLKEYVTGGLRTCMISPILIVREGFTVVPDTDTRPFLQASAIRTSFSLPIVRLFIVELCHGELYSG